MTPDDVAAAPDGLADYAKDTWKLPIAGVKVYVLGHEDQAVYTDATGHFTLTNVPTGDVKPDLNGLQPVRHRHWRLDHRQFGKCDLQRRGGE